MERKEQFGVEQHPKRSYSDKRIGVTPFIRCQFCGTPNDVRVTGSGKGEGRESVPNSDPPDFVVNAGCWFCGSLNWANGQKPNYGDDERTPMPKRWRQ